MQISPTEAGFVRQGICQGIRADGRAAGEWRPFAISVGCLPQASGSARAVLADSSDVLVGIKLDLAATGDSQAAAIHVVVDCPAAASLQAEGGRQQKPPADENAALTQATLQQLRSSLDLTQLAIAEGHCWTLQADVLVMANAGNLAGCLSLALLAALQNTAVPAARLVAGQLQVDAGCSEPLRLARFPLTVTAGICGDACFFDASAAEEASCACFLQASFAADGTLCGLAKTGCEPIAAPRLLASLRAAQQQAAALFGRFGAAAVAGSSSNLFF